jgi:hypothetical protein
MTPQTELQDQTPANDVGAAALLAAGLGAFSLGLIALLADRLPAAKSDLSFYPPTGSLSGVTTLAILVWLASWALLHWRWSHRTVSIRPITLAASLALLAGLLLTFPPFADLL